MSEEKVKSKFEQAKGHIKEKSGKLTGNKKLQSKGFVEKTAAKGKELVSDAKDTVEDVIDAIKDKSK
ncbi:TPA: CsbD family protein [Streptococcus agalactiae]|nr:CsbD family protein [Streptococcus agalactiae]